MSGRAAAFPVGAGRGRIDTATAAGSARQGLSRRADIDGLRAVAVLPVLLFHAGFPGFGGGFVGVDVFFVVSGYLITSIVLDELDAGRFSLIAFYERRVRRIFPALFVVLLVSLALGSLLLLPGDLTNLGQSAAAAAASASNLLFWHEAGYFDAEAERKPLLHTWSLAVEEQFYLALPIALLLLHRAGGTRLRDYTAAACLLSFLLAVWGVQHAPSAAFYSAPARAWELLLGSLLALGVVPPPGRQGARDALSLAGLGLIAVGVFAYSAGTPFPGAAALPPCVGAALVIHAGVGGRSLAGRFLCARPLVITGLISYSPYLWHRPLLVFARSLAGRGLTWAETLAVLALSVAVAAASWRWIERPFRGRRPLLSRAPLFAAAGLAIGTVVALGSGLHFARGLPDRLPPEAARLAEGAADRAQGRGRCVGRIPEATRHDDPCRLGSRGQQAAASFLLWGDSHAGALASAVSDAAARSGRAGSPALLPGCPPLAGVSVAGTGTAAARRCRAFNEAVLDRILTSDDVTTVILAAHWTLYATGTRYGREAEGPVVRLREHEGGSTLPSSGATNEAVFGAALERTVAALCRAGKEVVILGPVPEVGLPVPWTLALAAWRGRDVDIRPGRADFDERNRIALSALAGLGERGLATVVFPHLTLCEGEEGRCRVEEGAGPSTPTTTT